MLVVGGGGFFNETIPFIKQLSTQVDVSLLVSKDLTKELVASIGINQVSYIAPVTLRSRGRMGNILVVFIAFIDAFKSLCKYNPTVVICVGSSLAIPVFFVSKILIKKTIFIESITRVDCLSTTAEILLKLKICDRLYVQWVELEYLSKKILYKGGLL